MFCLPWLVSLGACSTCGMFDCIILTESGLVTDDDINQQCDNVLVETVNPDLDIELSNYSGCVVLEKLNTLETVKARMPKATLEVDPQDLNRGMLLDIYASRLFLRTSHEAAQGQYKMNITGNVSALQIDSFANDIYVFSETFTAYVVEIDDPAWLVQLNIGAATKIFVSSDRFKTAVIVLGIMCILAVLVIGVLVWKLRRGRLYKLVSPARLLQNGRLISDDMASI